MAATTIPALKLNNGVQMPALGLGVFLSPPGETTAAVEAASQEGYRHIDAAAAYGNDREVEMAAIDGLDTGRRGGPEPEDITLEAFGRDVPEA